jgi:uncharacterized protein YecT (DUF1311 family)
MGDIFIKWDDALKEIYGVLKIQLSVNEMEKLKNEQRKWLTYRDEEAKKDSILKRTEIIKTRGRR